MDQTFMKERPVFPLLLSMGIPMIISLMAGALYNIIDSIFVARLSEDAMTALSLVYHMQNLAHAIGVGFGVGMNAQIARHLGEGKEKEAEQTASTGLFLCIVHGIIITIAGIATIPFFLRSFTSQESVIQYGLQYFYLVFLFSVVDALGMTFEKVYQAVGKMLTSMFCILLGCGVNLILDPLLIFGLAGFPALGIRGAAIATGMGQLASLLAYLIIYGRNPLNLRLRPSHISLCPGICRNMYSVGLAASLNLALTSVLLTGLNAILAPFATVYVLVLGVYYKLQSFLYQSSCGLILGMRPLISYNYGAGERERVRKIYRYSLLCVAIIMLLGTILSQCIPSVLMGLFTQNQETIHVGSGALQIISWGFLISTVSVVSSGALEGLGKGSASLVISLLRYVVIILPLAFLLCHLIGPTGVWHSFWITVGLDAVVAFLIYRYQSK